MDRELMDDLSGEYQVPTQDFESEKAILALCMRRKDTMNDIVSKNLVPEDFADKRNAVIFKTLSEMYLDSEDVDKFILVDVLERKGKIGAAGGQDYIFSVADTAAVSANIKSYVSNVHQKSVMRQVFKLFDELKDNTIKGKYTVNDVVDLGVGKLTALREAPEGTGFEALQTILRRNLQQIHALSHGQNTTRAVPSGFRALDRMIGGFRPGTLNIVAARPAMGKTALVINMAVNAATFKHENVNIFSLEMSKEEIGNRILATRSSTSAKKLQSAKITQDEENELTQVFTDMVGLPIYIDDRSDVNPVTMMSACKTLKAEGKLGLVIVDYLQLMSMPGRGNNSSRQQEISDISRSLKVLAKDLNVPVIALSQLSRSTEKRENHTPMLSDLRDSGAIEQDADCVMFIDRDDYRNTDEAPPPVQDARIIVAKNRHGETGTVFLKWMGARTLFFEEGRPSDPQDPTQNGSQSSFRRTVTSDAAASNYNFEESSNSGEGDGGSADGVPDFIPPMSEDDVPMSNEENDEFFADSESGFPEDF